MLKINATTDNRRVIKKHEKPGIKRNEAWSRSKSSYPVTTLVQITHYTSPNYTDHPKWIYIEYTVFKIFALFRIFKQLALALKNSFPWKISLHWIYFLPFKIFEQLCACPED